MLQIWWLQTWKNYFVHIICFIISFSICVFVQKQSKTYSAYNYIMTWPKTMANALYLQFKYDNKIKYIYSHNNHKRNG